MLIETNMTIAYKCPSCGTFEFFNTSIFSFRNKSGCSFTCRCGRSSISIAEESPGNFRISIPCIGCGGSHSSTIRKGNLKRNGVNIIYCPEIGMQICFIGYDEEVREKIDTLERELDELINMFGYDSFFKNTQVMLDSLNKIHDIAEQGNLICECGNDDIELLLFPDRVVLKCRKCSGSEVIPAGTNGDLRDILKRQQLLLLQENSRYDTGTGKGLIMKTDGK